MGAARGGGESVGGDVAAHLPEFDVGDGVDRRPRHLERLREAVLLADVRLDPTRQLERRVVRRDGLVRLAHLPRFEDALVCGAPAWLARQQEHPRGEPVEAVNGHERRFVEHRACLDDDRLRDVPAARDGSEEVRLVDDDDAFVLVQHREFERHHRLLAQLAVEVDERVRPVRFVTVPGSAVVVDETAAFEHPVDVDVVGQLVVQERPHRRPGHGVRAVTIGRAHPCGTEAVTAGKGMKIWHGRRSRTVRRPRARGPSRRRRGRRGPCRSPSPPSRSCG